MPKLPKIEVSLGKGEITPSSPNAVTVRYPVRVFIGNDKTCTVVQNADELIDLMARRGAGANAMNRRELEWYVRSWDHHGKQDKSKKAKMAVERQSIVSSYGGTSAY